MEEKKAKFFNRDEFLNMVIKQFINKDPQRVMRNYDGFIRLIALDEKKQQNQQICAEKRRILKKCFDTFSNEEVKELVRKGNLSTQQIFSMFREKILGDNKRKYDMSDLYREGLISNTKTGNGKSVAFNKSPGRENTFTDLSGQPTKIKMLGYLGYKNCLGIIADLVRYQITRNSDGDKTETLEVYTNIDISKMDESDEYREVVLNELFSKNNIELSNTNGYVGIIEEDHAMDVGEEGKGEVGQYKYKVSPNFKLVFYPEELSAVRLYEEKNNGMPNRKIVENNPKDTGEER